MDIENFDKETLEYLKRQAEIYQGTSEKFIAIDINYFIKLIDFLLAQVNK